MALTPIQRHVSAAEIAPERLAANKSLTEKEKISEASRQFEAILLRQILEASQKTVIQSKFSDNSTASSIYHDLFTNQMADSISQSGSFGLASIFERQLDHRGIKHPADAPGEPATTPGVAHPAATAAQPAEPKPAHANHHTHKHPNLPRLHP